MRNVVIIQARMGSTRLPGKVMRMLAGKTVLEHVVQRASAIPGIDEVVVATTVQPDDDVIVEESRRLQVPFHRGSEADVLSRYYKAAMQARADVIMRITSDCPLLDPEVSGMVLQTMHEHAGTDYASNTLVRSYPRGLDTEVFTFQALETAYREANEPHQREHVTPYLYENPVRFTCKPVSGEADYSQYRWTLDTVEDWELIQQIYQALYQDKWFSWTKGIELMQARPDLYLINGHVEQKSK
ncbi:cytidylyltransferase domain-containing protein [Brevibacillus sp. H7]|uniref:cytidylyltransferase domain-containing protein n=1 Tax=Brevibacillus sp. H7 TaxID=3349138 RepID=UPI0038119C69